MALSTTKRGDVRRQEILDASRVCFLKNGFHATSMQDLLQAANMSAGAFYRYFPSKRAIVIEFARDAMHRTSAILDDAVAKDPPEPRQLIERIVKALHDMNLRMGGSSIAVLLWGEAQRDDDLKQALLEALQPLREWFMRVAVVYQERGLISRDADPRTAALGLIGIVQGYMAQVALFSTTPEDYLAGIGALMR